MQLGKIVGTLVSTRKEADLQGLRFMVVKDIDLDLKETGKMVIAADAVGSGVGEIVIYASGSSARQTLLTKDKPVDATIMAIVDILEVLGEKKYVKE